jgi:hypothetical protein
MDTKALFDKLQDAALVLNSTSDDFRTAIEQIDYVLANLRLGITVWVPSPEDNSIKLGYARIHGKWGLSIWVADECWAFNNAPRVFRYKTIDSLPGLLAAMLTVATELIQRLEEARATVTAINHAIGNISV